MAVVVVLLVAACGKVLVDDKSSIETGVIVLEVGFSWVLLGRWFSNAVSQLLTVSLFLIFGTISLTHSIYGTNCGCFGELAVPSWLVFLFDIILVIVCILGWPASGFRFLNLANFRYGSATCVTIFFILLGIAINQHRGNLSDDVGLQVLQAVGDRINKQDFVPIVSL